MEGAIEEKQAVPDAGRHGQAPLDPAKQQAFAGEMVDVLNKSAPALLANLGHQSGLFDTMATFPPSTSADVAKAAGLDERYVREWLGGMVVGGFIEYEPEGETYTLPPEHAASLTTAAGPDNLAGMMPYIGLMGEVEQQVVRCFQDGGGVPYTSYPRSQALQAEEAARVYDAALVSTIVPLCRTFPSGSAPVSTSSTWAPGRDMPPSCWRRPSPTAASMVWTGRKPASRPHAPRRAASGSATCATPWRIRRRSAASTT